MFTSVGVLEDKSSSWRILKDNFEVLGLGLGLESLALRLVSLTPSLLSNLAYLLYTSHDRKNKITSS